MIVSQGKTKLLSRSAMVVLTSTLLLGCGESSNSESTGQGSSNADNSSLPLTGSWEDQIQATNILGKAVELTLVTLNGAALLAQDHQRLGNTFACAGGGTSTQTVSGANVTFTTDKCVHSNYQFSGTYTTTLKTNTRLSINSNGQIVDLQNTNNQAMSPTYHLKTSPESYIDTTSNTLEMVNTITIPSDLQPQLQAGTYQLNLKGVSSNLSGQLTGSNEQKIDWEYRNGSLIIDGNSVSSSNAIPSSLHFSY
ncbi:hypothetical protein MHO82_24770 [Vibrio sp. Of7-15]|uniref:hypothetical protein n=1 Tax=Vibrio sp. Of7-15 TaxID=2724879 RepID=UPI001EF295FC|nr:hypothetical protein [Vibrio sp. Of7-15]MCG7500082.1 hypothetical protein [Vibrio sp. Of7-15]